MQLLYLAICIISIAVLIRAPPVREDKKPEEDDALGLEYERYLKEVVNVLESDEVFKKKLETMNATDLQGELNYNNYLQKIFSVLMSDQLFQNRMLKVKDLINETGDVAKHLELVSRNIRTKLDELKRQEIERLKILAKLHKKGINNNALKEKDRTRLLERLVKLMEHVDHGNPHSFEEADLRKLIVKATSDLREIDEKRREQFKQYELEKEAIRRAKLDTLDETKKKEEEKKFEELQKLHKDHPKLKHPGSKEQLEEVWEKEDGLDKQDFDPKSFFKLHDTNGDDLLDEEEIEALFQRELDKAYDPNKPEDDLMERYEEMSRMREHLMKEIDKDKDGMISYSEFLQSTNKEDFKKDEGWDTLDSEKQYTDEELEKFMKDFETKRKEKFGGHAQPGEVNIPNDVSIPPESIDHLNSKKEPDVNHMNVNN